MIDAVISWYQQHFIISTIATAAGLLVIAPLLLSKRSRRWAQRVLDGDIEIVGMVALGLAIVAFAVYNNVSR